jgi:ribonuclease H2 subunit A
LNALSHDTAIGLIRRTLDAGVMLKEVYLDTVGPPEKYEDKLRALFPNIKVKVSKKADSLYPVVSASSICAKVIRDRCIANWKFLEKIDQKYQSNYDYGSGYPGDPKTKDFLRKVFDKMFGFPTFIRFSWSTASTIIDKDGFKCNWSVQNFIILG